MKKFFILIVVFIIVLSLTGCKPDPDSTYKVTYHGNGNTFGFAPTDNNQYAIDMEAIVLDGHSLIKNGHSFQNWNTKADGTGSTYVSGDKITIHGPVFLYAIYNE